jgi:hypothetical protein
MPTFAKRDPGGAVLLAHLGDGNPRQPSEGRLYFATATAGSLFPGVGWLDTALDFPIDVLHSHPKLRQADALQDTLIPIKRFR